jgi:hypothetical protein
MWESMATLCETRLAATQHLSSGSALLPVGRAQLVICTLIVLRNVDRAEVTRLSAVWPSRTCLTTVISDVVVQKHIAL